jgi:adenylate cyclase
MRMGNRPRHVRKAPELGHAQSARLLLRSARIRHCDRLRCERNATTIGGCCRHGRYELERRLAAIMAADMVGYSRLMAADEMGTITRHKTLRETLIDPMVARHDGRVVKATGDGFLVEFSSVLNAVKCAIGIQTAVAEHEADDSSDNRIQYRIGINLGDIVVDAGDIFGDGVNVAARLEALADAGGVCISDLVYQNVKSKLDVKFESLGTKALKNIPGEIQVYRIRLDEPLRPLSPAAPKGRPTLPRKPSIAVLPFANMSSVRDQEFFADGMTEDIITALSRIREDDRNRCANWCCPSVLSSTPIESA